MISVLCVGFLLRLASTDANLRGSRPLSFLYTVPETGRCRQAKTIMVKTIARKVSSDASTEIPHLLRFVINNITG